LVSSVMFFSFSSAMVMIHLNPCTSTYSVVSTGDFQKGGDSGKMHSTTPGGKAGLVLRSPPLCLGNVLWFRQYCLPLRVSDPIQHAIHCFLDSGTGPMELPRGLGGKLAQHITIPQSL
jgi:hypothetical protein